MKRQKIKTIKPLFSAVLLITVITLPLWALAADKVTGTDTEKRAEAFLRQRQPQQAITLYAALLAKDPMNFKLRQKLLELYLLAGRSYDVELLVAQAQGLHPQGIEPVLLESQKLLGPIVSQGDFTREEAILPQLERLGREASYIDYAHSGTLYINGMVARLKAEPEQAEELLLRALYKEPNYLKALQALCDLYADQHQVKLAVPLVSQAMDLALEDVDSLYLVGRIFVEKGDPAKGLVYLKQSQERDMVDRPKRLWVMAEAQRQLGQSGEAMANYRKVLEYWPNRADIWVKYAQMAESTNQEDIAIHAYRKAYALQPGILSPLLEAVERDFWTQPLAETAGRYRRILRIARDRDDLLVLLAAMYYRMWQEGNPPLPSHLDEWETMVRVRNTSLPPLQLAEIQLQVVRFNDWTPGLAQVAENIVQSTVSPFLQAGGRLLLEQPDAAQVAFETLPGPTNPKSEIQRFVLLGAWPWAKDFAGSYVDNQVYQDQVADWAERDIGRFKTHIDESVIYLESRQTEMALKALKQARVFHPLSPELQLQYAVARMQLEQPEQAGIHVTVAQKLGLTQPQQGRASTLMKQVQKAVARKAVKANPAPQ